MSAKERPILMSGAMVRACLAVTKTQTRRVMKKQPRGILAGPNFDGLWSDTVDPVARYFGCPYGQPGDRLWVRETWNTSERWSSTRPRDLPEGELRIFYAADYNEEGLKICAPWRPSIFLPRWACRLVLEIVSVRVERLQEIEADDVCCEGLQSTEFMPVLQHPVIDGYLHADDQRAVKLGFQSLWKSINGPDSWAQNPWVWVVEFKRVLPA